MIKYIFIGFIVFLVVMYVAGSLLAPPSCIEIGSCKNCWQSNDVTALSDYCLDPSTACTASPAEQQHNAVVDTLFCACESARESSYADPVFNSRIQEVFSNFFKKEIRTLELCEQSGQYLVNIEYG